MRKIVFLLTLIAFLGCKNKEVKVESFNEIFYDSNDVVKVDNLIYLKRDMTLVTGIIHGFHNNGKQMEAYHVKEGKLNGASNSWNKYGQQRYQGNYKEGEQEGLWKFWWPNGQLKGESNYKNGKLNGIKKRWGKNGEVISEENWIDNNKQ